MASPTRCTGHHDEYDTLFGTAVGNIIPPTDAVNKVSENWTAYDKSSGSESLDGSEAMWTLNITESSETLGSSGNFSLLSYNATREAEESLLYILGELKRFIHESHIDVHGFELASTNLTKDFNDICSMIDEVLATNALLQKQLKFTKHVFNALFFAAQTFHENPFSGSIHGFLVYSMVELNVRLYILFDAYGNLDREIEHYEQKIYGFWTNMVSWNENFEELDLVPNESRRLFENQLHQASETIKNLWTQIS